jgi:subtilisin family serine protease
MPLRVLDANGSGSVADVIEAYGYASRNGARVVNASLGGSGRSEAERDAIRGAAGTLFVVAAGNDATDNEDTPQYPCNHSTDVDRPATNVVCVAASDRNDSLAWFSNFGSRSVHLAAPGTSVLSAQPVWSAHFDEGFETDVAGRWSTGGAGSAWGRTTTAAHAGAFSLTDSPTGGYQNLANVWAQTSSPIDLTGRAGCRLSNRLRHELERGADHLLVEASANGATWTALDRHTGSTGGAFRYFDYDLSGFDGRPVYLRYRLESNASVTADGAYVDSVRVSCLSSTYTGSELAYFDGTSMATPHVAGAAALVLARYPSAAVAEVKGRILNNVDPKDSLATKTTTGGRLNALRALTAEAAPPPPGPAPTQPPPAPPAQRDSTAPRLSVVVASRQRISKVLARGVAARVGCSEACTVRARLRLDGRTAKALRLSKGKPVVLGTGSRSFSGAGQAALSIRLSRRAKAGLRRARRTLRASLAIEATDPACNRSAQTRRIALKR